MIELPAWTGTELLWMRILLGALLLRFNRVPRPSDLTAPVGLSTLINLNPLVRIRGFDRLSLLLVPLFAAGVAQPLPAVGLAFVLLVTVTLDVSSGAVSHGRHLMVLVLLANAVAETVYWLDREFEFDWTLEPDLAPTWSVQLIAAMYFTAGAMKVVNTGGMWMARSPRFELQVLKGDYNASRKQQPIADQFTAFARRHPSVIRVAAVGGLALELLTPLALFHPVAMFIVGVSLIVMHRANGALLQLPFSQNQGIVAIYMVLFSLPLG